MHLQPLVRALFVGAHQARVASHIGGKNRGKTAGGGHFSPCATKVSNRAYAQVCQSRHCCMWVELPNPSAVGSQLVKMHTVGEGPAWVDSHPPNQVPSVSFVPVAAPD